MATKKQGSASRAKKTTRRKSSGTRGYVPPSARRVRGGLKCPDCGFVAKHAMGLGRHRSSRHGVVSKRSARTGTATGRWISREQAAERANVHYNTIRQWERAGIVKATKRPGVRGVMLSVDDLERFLVERGGYQLTPTSDASAAAISALQSRYDRLIADLEQLLDAAKTARPTTTNGSGGKKKAGAKKTSRKKATARRRR